MLCLNLTESMEKWIHRKMLMRIYIREKSACQGQTRKQKRAVFRLNGLENKRDKGAREKALRSVVVFKCDQWQVRPTGLWEKTQRLQKKSALSIIISSVPQRDQVWQKTKAWGQNKYVQRLEAITQTALQQIWLCWRAWCSFLFLNCFSATALT